MRYICTRLGICSNGIQKLVSYEPQTEPYKHHNSTNDKGAQELVAYPAAGEDGVVHHGLAGDRKERLGHVQRQRPEPRPCTRHQHQSEPIRQEGRGRRDYGVGWRGADLAALTFGGAADHDDGDDALLGAGHGCSASIRRRWRSGGGKGQGRDARGRRRGEIYGDGMGFGGERGPRVFLAEAKAMPIRRRTR